MGQAAAYGVEAFEKGKLILNHLVITSIVKFLFRLILKTHLTSSICGNGV